MAQASISYAQVIGAYLISVFIFVLLGLSDLFDRFILLIPSVDMSGDFEMAIEEGATIVRVSEVVFNNKAHFIKMDLKFLD